MGNLTLGAIILVSIFVALCRAQCGQLFDNKLSDSDRSIILNTHNDLRSLISKGEVSGQPRGMNLKTIRWDDYLANQAQQIANTCKFKHVAVHDERFAVGQNLGWSGSSNKVGGADWKGTIEMWFNEHKNFTYPDKSTGDTGHYTQVVWADTYLIGCGYTWYHKQNDIWYEKLYVCNYGPAGNIVGQAPYKV